MSGRQSETVVLIHGLAGSRLDMFLVSNRLKKAGFTVVNWGYWSLNTSIQVHADRLAKKVEALEENPSVEKIHLVGHSMGGIIIRTMLANVRHGHLLKLSRAIQLAPPNRGSHAATKLGPFVGWLTPSLGELSDLADSFVNRLPNSLKDQEIEFGVVEATKDRVIHPNCVQLEGQHDFAQVVGHHGVLTWYPQTQELIERFLLTGTFDEDDNRLSNPSAKLCDEDAVQV